MTYTVIDGAGERRMNWTESESSAVAFAVVIRGQVVNSSGNVVHDYSDARKGWV